MALHHGVPLHPGIQRIKHKYPGQHTSDCDGSPPTWQAEFRLHEAHQQGSCKLPLRLWLWLCNSRCFHTIWAIRIINRNMKTRVILHEQWRITRALLFSKHFSVKRNGESKDESPAQDVSARIGQRIYQPSYDPILLTSGEIFVICFWGKSHIVFEK